MKQLTRIQYFNNLPEEVKHKAISNYQNEFKQLSSDMLKFEFPNIETCIKESFNIHESPEGAEYWEKLFKNTKNDKQSN